MATTTKNPRTVALSKLQCGTPMASGWYTEHPAAKQQLCLVGPFPGRTEASALARLVWAGQGLSQLRPVNEYQQADLEHLSQHFADLGLTRVRVVDVLDPYVWIPLKALGVKQLTAELVDQMLNAGPLPEQAVTISEPTPAEPVPAETTLPAVEPEPVVPVALPVAVAVPVLADVPVAIPIGEAVLAPVTEQPAPTIEAAEPVTTEEAQKPARKRIAPEVVAEGKRLLAEGSRAARSPAGWACRPRPCGPGRSNDGQKPRWQNGSHRGGPRSRVQDLTPRENDRVHVLFQPSEAAAGRPRSGGDQPGHPGLVPGSP
jgi:hypothetical protein